MEVNWDDEIPNIWENKPNVPNHQPVYDSHGISAWDQYPRDSWNNHGMMMELPVPEPDDTEGLLTNYLLEAMSYGGDALRWFVA